jgi:heme A synthase
MDTQATAKLSKFAGYARFVWGLNFLVILWGVFLRASKSGDGCGQHWLTCNGEVIPSAPALKTVIEFSHRTSSGLALLAVLLMFIWAVRAYPKTDPVRKAAFASLVFIIIEALIGAGLVLTGNTAEANTAARPLWAAAHLINSFALLGSLTLTAWFAAGGRPFSFRAPRKILMLLGTGALGILLVGISGVLVALSNMLFPSTTLAEGLAQDFSSSSPILINLRILHPILSIALGVYLYGLALWVIKQFPESGFWLKRLANVLTGLIVLQLIAGALTYVSHAPILMQLIHLLLADLVWVVFVLLAGEFLAGQNEIFLAPSTKGAK